MKTEWEDQLREVGNKKSNEVYEETLPPVFNKDKLRKDVHRSQFILDKYKEMKYTSAKNKEKILAERDRKRAQSLAKSKATAAAIIAATPSEWFSNDRNTLPRNPTKKKQDFDSPYLEDRIITSEKTVEHETIKEETDGPAATDNKTTNNTTTEEPDQRNRNEAKLVLLSNDTTANNGTGSSSTEETRRGMLQKWSRSLDNIVVKFTAGKND